jgi:hypothetical protein
VGIGAFGVQKSPVAAETGLTGIMRSGISKIRMSIGAACLLMFLSLLVVVGFLF